MRLIMDLHTHTLASVHAYSTVTENAREAKRKGLEILGVSDHGYGMKHTTLPEYWFNLKVLPNYLEGVRLLKGIEMNICNHKGDLFEEDLLGKTDYVVASIHGNVFDYSWGDTGDYTQAMVGAVERYPQINILGHPDDGRFPVDYERVMRACKENGVAVEINVASLKPDGFRQNTHENQKKYLKICKELEVPVIIDSDAHMSTWVGDFDLALEIIKEVDFPEELIVNTSWEKLEKLLGRSI